MAASVDDFSTMTDADLGAITSGWTYNHLAYFSKALWTLGTQESLASQHETASRRWWDLFAVRYLPFFGGREDALQPATALRSRMISFRSATLVSLWLTLPSLALALWLTVGSGSEWLDAHLHPPASNTASTSGQNDAVATAPASTASTATLSTIPEISRPRDLGTKAHETQGNSSSHAVNGTGILLQEDHVVASNAGAATATQPAACLDKGEHQRDQDRLEIGAAVGFIFLVIWTFTVWRVAVTPVASVPRMSRSCERAFVRLYEYLGTSRRQQGTAMPEGNEALAECLRRAFSESIEPGQWFPAELALLLVLSGDRSVTARRAAFRQLELKAGQEKKVPARARRELKRLGMLD